MLPHSAARLPAFSAARKRSPGALGVSETQGQGLLRRLDLERLPANLADQQHRQLVRCQLLQQRRLAAEHEAARPLSEQGCLAGDAALLDQRVEVDAATEPGRDRALGKRTGKTSVADVVSGGDGAR